MTKIEKNTLLQYTPGNFLKEIDINPLRIHIANKNKIRNGEIIYLCDREIRAADNFALQFAYNKSKEFNLPLKIIYPKIKSEYLPKQIFIDRQINFVKNALNSLGLNFEVTNTPDLKNCGALIIDFNPLLNRSWVDNLNFKVYEVDGHNIIPARFISDKQEYNAATFRRKVYNNIYPFLTEFENTLNFETEAEEVLKNFINTGLNSYQEFKNNPQKNVLSKLSKYLNLGFISSQRVAIEIIKSDASAENKETFLEELIIRKELSDNFCLYTTNYKSFYGIPKWAKETLKFHQNDLRRYIYSEKEFEQAKTHDPLWNATQSQLLKEGIIHSYLRMYWAKKILEWSPTPKKALKTAIYLNDKYAYDAPSTNGYVGILWSIGGLHDRAFKDYLITGKIRKMTFDSMKKKFDIYAYINEYK